MAAPVCSTHRSAAPLYPCAPAPVYLCAAAPNGLAAHLVCCALLGCLIPHGAPFCGVSSLRPSVVPHPTWCAAPIWGGRQLGSAATARCGACALRPSHMVPPSGVPFHMVRTLLGSHTTCCVLVTASLGVAALTASLDAAALVRLAGSCGCGSLVAAASASCGCSEP